MPIPSTGAGIEPTTFCRLKVGAWGSGLPDWREDISTTCSAGTKTSSATTVSLPVPRIPAMCQVFSIDNSLIGTRATPPSGAGPSAPTTVETIAQVAWCEPEAQLQRPLSTYPPSASRAGEGLPTVAHTVASGSWLHIRCRTSAGKCQRLLTAL
ncbi:MULTISPECIES: hypothetical protein [unclassified Streptomyces]|uniref:hypothetical protein n=1 Tax=unclassified Streptomyces TaxID=2593676 RepID=UPI0019D47A9E|nr:MULTISPECIES: hypothetical protein [unclassified Streptomyces]